MPLFSFHSDDDDGELIELYYETHGVQDASDPRPKVLLLMGFGATGVVWAPQLADLLATSDEGSEESPMSVCIMDNRGVGRSSCPASLRSYSTENMSRDAMALMDLLGWQRFHVVGHSMGSMIATKLAAFQPQRVLSLSLISGTGGGWEAVPQSLTALWLGIKKLFVRSIEARAAVDIQFHFSPSLLAEFDPVTKQSRREILIGEYVEAYREEQDQQSGGHGARGQMAAVFGHRLQERDIKSIQLGQFPMQVIHGRQDIMALPKYSERLAARLQAPCIMLEGGHFVIREQAAAVNALLRSIILGTSWANVERYPYMPFRFWVRMVEEHRERASALAARRAQQGAPEAQQDRGQHKHRHSWPFPLGSWELAGSMDNAGQEPGEAGQGLGHRREWALLTGGLWRGRRGSQQLEGSSDDAEAASPEQAQQPERAQGQPGETELLQRGLEASASSSGEGEELLWEARSGARPARQAPGPVDGSGAGEGAGGGELDLAGRLAQQEGRQEVARRQGQEQHWQQQQQQHGGPPGPSAAEGCGGSICPVEAGAA